MSPRRANSGEPERRNLPAPVEIRASGGRRGIGGLGIPTGVVADIGPFTEEIAPEAVRDAVNRGFDVRGLYNHDPNMVLARTKSGTMTVRASNAGLEYEIPELPKSRADVLESVERGDVDGNSFSFTVAKSGDLWDRSGEKPHRRITRFANLFDVGPVTFPAYGDDTVVSARSLDRCTGPLCGLKGAEAAREAQRLSREIRSRWTGRSAGTSESRKPKAEPLPPPGRFGRDIRQILLHEAAHCATAFAVGMRSRGVTIEYRDGRPTGRATSHFVVPKRGFPPVVALAGIVSEQWSKPRPSPLKVRRLIEESSATDRKFTEVGMARADGTPGYPKRLEYAWAEAVATLRANWNCVESLADEMARTPGGSIDGPTVERICRQHNVQWVPADP